MFTLTFDSLPTHWVHEGEYLGGPVKFCWPQVCMSKSCDIEVSGSTLELWVVWFLFPGDNVLLLSMVSYNTACWLAQYVWSDQTSPQEMSGLEDVHVTQSKRTLVSNQILFCNLTVFMALFSSFKTTFFLQPLIGESWQTGSHTNNKESGSWILTRDNQSNSNPTVLMFKQPLWALFSKPIHSDWKGGLRIFFIPLSQPATVHIKAVGKAHKHVPWPLAPHSITGAYVIIQCVTVFCWAAHLDRCFSV